MVAEGEHRRLTGLQALLYSVIGIALGAALALWGWHQMGGGPRAERGPWNVVTGLALLTAIPLVMVVLWREGRRR